MDIPLEYQILIGSAIGGLVLFLIREIRDYRKEVRDESQKLAIWAIIIGVLIIIPFISVVGLLLAIVSYFRKKNKTLSKVAFIINLLALLPWLAVLIFGT